MQDLLTKMIAVASKTPRQKITDEQILSWANGMDLYDFYNFSGIEIAREFQRDPKNYPKLDAIINDIWASVLRNLCGERVPEPFFQIYEAFDAGEFHRLSEKSDNPVLEFTAPMIADILLIYESNANF